MKRFALSRGASLVGIAPINRLSRAPQGHRPRDLLSEAKAVISIALRINKSSVLHLPRTMREYKINYEMANVKLNSLAWETARFLEDQGFQALAIPASHPYDSDRQIGDISNKHAAVAAGLGRFGLNNLVLTPRYGPYVRFVTIVTSANLNPDRILKDDICLREKCQKCIQSCPPHALEKPKYDPYEGWRINKKKCLEYMRTVSDGDICGLCIKACPVVNTGRLDPRGSG